MLESLFNKVAGMTPILKNIFQQLLFYGTRITATTVNISNVYLWFKFKRLRRIKSDISFSLKSLSSVLFSFSMFFYVFLSFASFFLFAANKKDSFNLFKRFSPH